MLAMRAVIVVQNWPSLSDVHLDSDLDIAGMQTPKHEIQPDFGLIWMLFGC